MQGLISLLAAVEALTKVSDSDNWEKQVSLISELYILTAFCYNQKRK